MEKLVVVEGLKVNKSDSKWVIKASLIFDQSYQDLMKIDHDQFLRKFAKV